MRVRTRSGMCVKKMLNLRSTVHNEFVPHGLYTLHMNLTTSGLIIHVNMLYSRSYFMYHKYVNCSLEPIF